jgi:hypothetical protein
MHRLVRWMPSVALVAITPACASPKARSPYDALVAPDERTVSTWILRALRKERLEAETGRTIDVGGAKIVAEASVVGKPWSIVWLRRDEQADLAAKFGFQRADGALLVYGGAGDDAAERFLVLLEQDYRYDKDPRGDEGVVRSVQEVEARVIRDVVDFLVRAREGRLP